MILIHTLIMLESKLMKHTKKMYLKLAVTSDNNPRSLIQLIMSINK